MIQKQYELLRCISLIIYTYRHFIISFSAVLACVVAVVVVVVVVVYY